MTAFGRLYLGNLLPDTEKCVYLDCDLVVRMNVNKIFSTIDNQVVLYVDGAEKRKHALHKQLYEQAGLDLNGPFFNTGVLGINLSLWRKRNYIQRCERTIRDFAGKFRDADQFVLNMTLAHDHCCLGADFNAQIWPSSAKVPTVSTPAIYHFVGSPKPWDFLGRYLHGNYALWNRYYCNTAIANHPLWRYWSAQRAFRISKLSEGCDVQEACTCRVTPKFNIAYWAVPACLFG